jgi:hypothetical protein
MEKTVPARPKKPPYWLIYVSLLMSGVLLLADAYNVTQLSRWTARLGIALVFSALSLLWPKSRIAGQIAALIIWIAVIVSYFI